MKHKLLVSIVNRGKAKKLVKATLGAGAEGGTTLLGEGTGLRHTRSLLGMTIEQENEVVFTLVGAEKAHAVLDAALAGCGLDRPGHGVAFMSDVRKAAGISHNDGTAGQAGETTGGAEMEEAAGIPYDLIITVVDKNDADTVVDASTDAGAEGGTILFGRGTGIHEHAKILGITVEPEKGLVLTLVDRRKSEKVLDAIVRKTGLDRPGKGIAFIIGVERVAGICHLPSS